METNPRVRMPVEWAPPPPVAVPDRQHPQPPPVPAPSQEKEFEEILGGLVEHYSALPPPAFGEPHEVAFEAGSSEQTITTRRRSRTGLWVGLTLGGILFAGSLAVGAFYLWQLKERASLVSEPGKDLRAQEVRVAPDLKLTVQSSETKVSKAPKVEPLATATEAQAEPVVVAKPAVTAPPHKTAPLRVKARKRRQRRRSRQVRRRTSRRRSPARSDVEAAEPAKPSTADDWEDPYN